MDRLLRLTRLAAIALSTLAGAAALAPSQAEARHERGWVGGEGMDHHYRPVRQVRREQRWQQRHYVPRHHAPVYYEPAYRAPIYRRAPVYYQSYPAYGYQQHCEVKKRWHGLRKVRKVVCY